MLELEQPKGSYYFYDQWFLAELAQRNKLERNTLGAFTGKPGRGKTVAALSTALALDPEFTVDKIVFTANQFKKAIDESKQFSWIVWDEPNKGLSHQDWYSEMNKAVTRFLQTSRFHLKNVLFALPKLDLMAKSARPVLLFEGVFWTHKLASIYELEPNHFGSTPELYKNFLGEAEFKLPPRELWKAYENKREEWHKKEFPDETFTEESGLEKLSRRYKEWAVVLAHVKGNPDRYKDPNKGNRITALQVSSIEGCSDQTARKVIRNLAIEEATKN